jgi:hypothetical protein
MRPFEAIWALFNLEIEDNVTNIGQEPNLLNELRFQPVSSMDR